MEADSTGGQGSRRAVPPRDDDDDDFDVTRYQMSQVTKPAELRHAGKETCLLDVTSVCQPKQTISNTSEYGKLKKKPNINCTRLN